MVKYSMTLVLFVVTLVVSINGYEYDDDDDSLLSIMPSERLMNEARYDLLRASHRDWSPQTFMNDHHLHRFRSSSKYTTVTFKEMMAKYESRLKELPDDPIDMFDPKNQKQADEWIKEARAKILASSSSSSSSAGSGDVHKKAALLEENVGTSKTTEEEEKKRMEKLKAAYIDARELGKVEYGSQGQYAVVYHCHPDAAVVGDCQRSETFGTDGGHSEELADAAGWFNAAKFSDTDEIILYTTNSPCTKRNDDKTPCLERVYDAAVAAKARDRPVRFTIVWNRQWNHRGAPGHRWHELGLVAYQSKDWSQTLTDAFQMTKHGSNDLNVIQWVRHKEFPLKK